MPQNITDVPTFTTPIVAPASGDGVTGAGVALLAQGLANRTAFLNALIAAGLGIPIYASAAALRLAPSPGAAESVAAVLGLGLFVWSPASTATDNGLFVIQITGVATGRWLSLTTAVGNVALGIPQNDSSGRVAAANVRNGLLEDLAFDADGAGPLTYGWSGVTVYTLGLQQIFGNLAIATLVGDVIEASFTSSITVNNGISAAGVIDVELALGYSENGGAYTNFPGAKATRQRQYATTEFDIAPVGLQGQRVVAAGGTFTVGVNGCTPSGSTLIGNWGLFDSWNLRIRHLRP